MQKEVGPIAGPLEIPAFSFQDSDGLVDMYNVINWLPPRDSNPDMLLQRQLSYH
jgi:hypothetical protein